MALAAFFLLLGILAAELAVVGLREAGYVGAVLFLLSAIRLIVLRQRQRPTP